MAANATMRNYSVLEFLDEISTSDSEKIVTEICNEKYKEESKEDYNEVLAYASRSIKAHANASYKSHTFIEVSDIEKIKDALNQFANKNDKVAQFKKELINDLTSFEMQIKIDHAQNLIELAEEKQFCQKQIQIFEFGKQKLIRERLAKMAWPYDSKTKEYDKKIEILNEKLSKIEQTIEEAKAMRPMAKEKEVLAYQQQLINKFSK